MIGVSGSLFGRCPGVCSLLHIDLHKPLAIETSRRKTNTPIDQNTYNTKLRSYEKGNAQTGGMYLWFNHQLGKQKWTGGRIV